MTNDPTKTQAIWGGRFTQLPSNIMQKINASIHVDKRLAAQDIAGSKAHANMLAAQGIISTLDNKQIQEGLDKIASEIEKGEFDFREELEDIHMNIEARLKEIIGESAGKLHTARSRNDQVVTDFRLWIRGALDETISTLTELQRALVVKAGDNTETLMPGFTHLQTAQPVVLGHHLLAYVEMLARDIGRLEDTKRRANESPLGAAALAGTGFDIDRHATSDALEFDRPMANSMDAISSRDFALEAMAALSISATHLSRLAEEVVLWTSAPFGFAKLSDAWSTGSSIMPQKRNPDAAELIRGKASQLTANFVALQGAVKALPLTYAKDLQDDKALTFDAFDSFVLSVQAMTGMIETLTFNSSRMREEAAKGYSTATDLADWLVRKLGLPFREAHHVTGAIVAWAEKNGADLQDVPLEAMQNIHPNITLDVYTVLSVEASVASRTSFGGTAPVQVAEHVRLWKTKLSQN